MTYELAGLCLLWIWKPILDKCGLDNLTWLWPAPPGPGERDSSDAWNVTRWARQAGTICGHHTVMNLIAPIDLPTQPPHHIDLHSDASLTYIFAFALVSNVYQRISPWKTCTLFWISSNALEQIELCILYFLLCFKLYLMQLLVWKVMKAIKVKTESRSFQLQFVCISIFHFYFVDWGEWVLSSTENHYRTLYEPHCLYVYMYHTVWTTQPACQLSTGLMESSHASYQFIPYHPLSNMLIIPPQFHNVFWRKHNNFLSFKCSNSILIMCVSSTKLPSKVSPRWKLFSLIPASMCWAEIYVVSRLSNSHKLLSDIQHQQPRQSTHCFCFDNLKRKHWEYNMRNCENARQLGIGQFENK